MEGMNLRSLLIAFLYAISLCGVLYSQEDIALLRRQLEEAKPDSVKCEILNHLVEIAPEGEWQNYNQQLRLLSLQNIKQLKDTKELKRFYKYFGISLHNSGINYSEQSNYEKAIGLFYKSIDFFKLSGDRNQIAISLQALAQIQIRKGNSKNALEQLYESLQIFEEYNDEIGIADVHLSLGDIYFSQRDYKRALEHHLRSYDLYRKNNYAVAISSVLFKIGVDYSEAKDYTKALEFLQKSISELEHSEYSENPVPYLNISQIYIYQSQYDKALSYAENGLRLAQLLNNKLETNHACILLGKIYSLQTNYQKAIEYDTKAYELAKEIGHPSEMNLAARQLYEVYEQTGQKAKAGQMYRVFVDTKNSLDNQEAKDALLEEKLKYEYEKKGIIAQAENEKHLAEIKAENQRKNLIKNIWIISFAALLVLLIVSAYFLYRNFKQKNVITEQKNNLLKQKLLVSQMNPHFIFNSLSAIQNYIFKQDSLKAGNYLAQFSELIRMILDYSRKDYITVDSEVKLLNNYLQLQSLRFENKFEYFIHIDEEIDVLRIQIPPMLAQPFIENSIEHGIYHMPQDGRIDVRLFYEGRDLIYEIEDNGVGIEEAMKLRTKLKSSYESLATIITKERMKTMSEAYNKTGDIEIIDKKKRSVPQAGVKVRFKVPFINTY